MAEETKPDNIGEAFREVVRRAQEAEEVPGEGLRERKKRLTRQQISDTATAMFLERGFDEVRVADVAEACGISEKTVFNYFANKESLLLDREPAMEAMLRRALGPDAPPGSPVEAVVAEIEADLERTFGLWRDLDAPAIDGIRRFIALVESTPALRAAQRDMMDRQVQVAAEALAGRAGVNPLDPEPQIAAVALLGLWGIQFDALKALYAEGQPEQKELALVSEQVRRAARLIDTGLWSFNAAVQGATSRQQLKVAADAANDARKQVVVAIKSARDAWRSGAAEAHALRAELEGERSPALRGGGRAGAVARQEAQRQRRAAQAEVQRQVKDSKREVQTEVQQAKREVQRATAELKKAAAQAKAAGKDRGRPPRSR
ncbi:hypothetical protein BH10ACT1_BH10ACT1_06180 [soil metagenome]